MGMEKKESNKKKDRNGKKKRPNKKRTGMVHIS
jgi:hypothetical protein